MTSLSGVLPRELSSIVKTVFGKQAAFFFVQKLLMNKIRTLPMQKQSLGAQLPFFASAEEMPVYETDKKRNEKRTDNKKQIYSFEATADGDDVLIEAL